MVPLDANLKLVLLFENFFVMIGLILVLVLLLVLVVLLEGTRELDKFVDGDVDDERAMFVLDAELALLDAKLVVALIRLVVFDDELENEIPEPVMDAEAAASVC